MQETLHAAIRNRLLLKGLTPKQRSGWFWVVVTRLTQRFAGRQSKAAQLLGVDDAPGIHDLPDPRAEEPPVTLERSERIELIRAVIARLPEPWRKVLAARNAHGEDWAAIAAACETTEGAARGLWFRAMTALRERLQRAERHDESGD